MKKIVLSTLLALAVVSASALEVGVSGSVGSPSPTTPTQTTYAVSVGENFGGYTITGGYSTQGVNNLSTYTLVGSNPAYRFGNLVVNGELGLAHVTDVAAGVNGNALITGFAAVYPLSKNVSAVVDYRYQIGDGVRVFNGNNVSVGAKYSF